MASEQIQDAEAASRTPSIIHSASGREAKSGHKNGVHKDAAAQASESIARANQIQQETTAQAAERMKCLLTAYANYARGLLEMQRAYIDLTHRALELTQRATRELIRCNSPSELAELQRDVLNDGMKQVFEGASKILHASSCAAEDAIRPIEEQLKHAA